MLTTQMLFLFPFFFYFCFLDKGVSIYQNIPVFGSMPIAGSSINRFVGQRGETIALTSFSESPNPTHVQQLQFLS